MPLDGHVKGSVERQGFGRDRNRSEPVRAGHRGIASSSSWSVPPAAPVTKMAWLSVGVPRTQVGAPAAEPSPTTALPSVWPRDCREGASDDKPGAGHPQPTATVSAAATPAGRAVVGIGTSHSCPLRPWCGRGHGDGDEIRTTPPIRSATRARCAHPGKQIVGHGDELLDHLHQAETFPYLCGSHTYMQGSVEVSN